NVAPSYSRFDLALDRGEGSYVWDVTDRRYLDLGTGNAVSCLGHAHPEISDALLDQSRKLLHVSNLYYSKPQGQLAEALVRLIGAGRCFFCNSGAEAHEGLFKLARKFGQDEGRFEIITANGSAQVPFNDLDATRSAISPKTAAVLIEAIQRESGFTPATADYLIGLRRLCDEQNILLLLDEVQPGHFRTGRFQSWQRLLEKAAGGDRFSPDAVSMANSLGGGFPIGAFWVRERYADLLSPGTDASIFGGSPLGCAVALKILEIIERDQLADHARQLGDFIKAELQRLIRKFPSVLKEVRGLGLMVGLEFRDDAPGLSRSEKAPARQVAERLHAAGVLTIPAANSVIRILPPLNLTQAEAIEGLHAIEAVTESLEN
ncbi:MAG TPA: aminotransferase class III-fold pyridoxal phosphate-dependent enzyme, partial [Chthoniobacterales bacterium]|nr:aminotransferase class III-fold pyridoxal phosphate-dependent enzyme [Chthoniobacterales bacterium]